MPSSVNVRRSSVPVRGDVVRVLFASGLERNRMTRAVVDELTRCVTDLGQDPTVGTVLIGASGSDFSAGADEAVLAGGVDVEGYVDAEYDLFDRVEELPAVTVALLDGLCLGNAAELSLACDFRVAGPQLRWGFPEARRGLMAPVSRLVRQIPRGIATRMALGGAWLDTRAALEAGAVDATVADVRSEEQVLAALDGLVRATPAGARWTKQALRDAAQGRHRERELATASLAEAAGDGRRGAPDEDA